ncbi:MAG TPA: putative glycoside hydrolase, partial [Gemmatimonadaceae bacterium]|nr:putative glycoside hydrolase [Gemmatimonadaceae bacterium]
MMTTARIGTVAYFLVSVACQHRGDAAAQAGAADITLQPGPAGSSTARAADPVVPPRVVRVPTPDTLRGLYVNRWAALGRKLNTLIGVAKRTEVNALVIDVKDDRGFVLYKSTVPLAR